MPTYRAATMKRISCTLALLLAAFINPAAAQPPAVEAQIKERIAARQAQLSEARAARDGDKRRLRKIEKLHKKASKAADKEDWEQYSKYKHEACELDDAATCIGLAGRYSTETVARQVELASRACRLDPRYCVQASYILREHQGEQAAEALLQFGCMEQLVKLACRRLAELQREQAKLPSIFDEHTPLVTVLCHAARSNEGITEGCSAYREATATSVAAAEAEKNAEIERKNYRDRALPIGATAECADKHSQQFGLQLDHQSGNPGQARAAYQTLVHRCGGQVLRAELKPACAKLHDRPPHQRLLCTLAEGGLANGFSHPASGFSISKAQLAEDFRPAHYLPAGSRGHQGPAPSLQGSVRTGLGPAPYDRPHPTGGALLTTVSELGGERVTFDFTASGLWVTVPRSAHELGEPLNAIRLSAYPASIGDPGSNPKRNDHHIDGWVDKQVWHQADWDEQAKHWRARTAYRFDISGSELAKLPADAVLYLNYSIGDQRIHIQPELSAQRRWVLGMGRFAQNPPRLPSAEDAAAMQAAIERGPLPFDSQCGALRDNWQGSRNDRFTERESRQHQRQRFLECRQRILDNETAALARLPQTGPTSFEYWLRLLRERELHQANYYQQDWLAGLATQRALLADDRRDARAADRRDARRAAAEVEANKPDKAAEYMAYLDQENYRRQQRGLPPIGVSSSGSSKPKPSSTRKPERTGGSSGSGSSAAPTVLCETTGDPDTDTCMSDQERTQALKRRERERNREQLRQWFLAEQRRCFQENRVENSCSHSGLIATEAHELAGLIDGYKERSRGLAGKMAGFAGIDTSAVRDCPPYEDNGVTTTSWKRTKDVRQEPICETKIVGDQGGISCMTRAYWTCRADVRRKQANGER